MISYARILVEVDVTQKLPNDITIRDSEGKKLKQPFGHHYEEVKAKKVWQMKSKQGSTSHAQPKENNTGLYNIETVDNGLESKKSVENGLKSTQAAGKNASSSGVKGTNSADFQANTSTTVLNLVASDDIGNVAEYTHEWSSRRKNGKDNGKKIVVDCTPNLIRCTNGFEALEDLNDPLVYQDGKLKEIGSRLLELRPTITILIETRVKQVKARNIRNKLRLQGEFLDNYSSHSNGRIWLNWDTNKVTIKYIRETSQLLHCGVYDLTAIYALNKLDQRRTLWTDIECIHGNQHGPWVLLGDFNNVLKAKDRVGGNLVTESEYEDLAKMMRNTRTFEKDSTGDYYTWSNKQTDGMIYSRIDRVLGNVEWFQDNIDTMLQILPPSVSDHALLCLADPGNTAGRQFHFKFSNCLTDLEEYHSTVSNSWNEPLNGRPMYVLWEKLKRLKPALNKINRPLHHIQSRIMEARQNLQHAQQSLVEDRWNSSKIDTVKRYTEEVINWNSLEEKTLQQKSKIDWLRLGDGNNSYFHATIKAKKSSKRLNLLHKDDGTVITSRDEIQDEVLNFYEGLMGTKDGNWSWISSKAKSSSSSNQGRKKERNGTKLPQKQVQEPLSLLRQQLRQPPILQ
ncbi:hypothetical protein HKD37_14G039672 [Glycine soja]